MRARTGKSGSDRDQGRGSLPSKPALSPQRSLHSPSFPSFASVRKPRIFNVKGNLRSNPDKPSQTIFFTLTMQSHLQRNSLKSCNSNKILTAKNAKITETITYGVFSLRSMRSLWLIQLWLRLAAPTLCVSAWILHADCGLVGRRRRRFQQRQNGAPGF